MMLSDIQDQVDPEGKWEDLQSIGRQDSMRVVNGKTTIETRYFISSLPNNALVNNRFNPAALGGREFLTLGIGYSFS